MSSRRCLAKKLAMSAMAPSDARRPGRSVSDGHVPGTRRAISAARRSWILPEGKPLSPDIRASISAVSPNWRRTVA